MITRVIILLTGYAFGLIQNGHYISKHLGVDITHKGSGNVGATNVLRVMGTKLGLIVFILDVLKALVPCLIVRLIFKNDVNSDLYVLYMGAGVVLGHCFPVQFGFKGGKGISSAIGFIIIYDYRIALCMIAIFLICVLISRYISLGSVVAAFALPFLAFFFKKPGPESMIIIILLVCLVIFKHRSNIKRIINGTENKFSLRKTSEKSNEVKNGNS
ncbi:MAG: glycerol-3-phosphate 1-O-acyltransferase PlsY [Lachnospiraceae bacterium]|nr:glycerol-3-phosphate 1-O-acyltransferase PlsY [Lachnospiraceae bacterium]